LNKEDVNRELWWSGWMVGVKRRDE